METRIRMLRPDDWREWREIRLRSLADAPDAFGSSTAGESAHGEPDWRSDLAEGTTVLALVEAAPVGCGAVFEKRPGLAAVVAMWVDPNFRGQGLSHRILDTLLGWAHQRRLTVEIGVNQNNPVARAAYESFGFVPTGRCHPLRVGSDQVCDVLELNAPG